TRCTCTGNRRMPFSPKFTWAHYVSWARILLATSALTIGYLYPPLAATNARDLFYVIMGLYVAYATAIAVRGKSHTGMLGLLALFGDTIYFLILASYGGDPLLWLASIFYLYLLAEAVI